MVPRFKGSRSSLRDSDRSRASKVRAILILARHRSTGCMGACWCIRVRHTKPRRKCGALERYPNQFKLLSLLGCFLYYEGKTDEAEQALRGDPEFQRLMSEVEGYWKHYTELFGQSQA
jgi:hypothetical protein